MEIEQSEKEFCQTATNGRLNKRIEESHKEWTNHEQKNRQIGIQREIDKIEQVKKKDC